MNLEVKYIVEAFVKADNTWHTSARCSELPQAIAILNGQRNCAVERWAKCFTKHRIIKQTTTYCVVPA